MSKRKRYDDKFRASAVVMLEAAGYPDRKGALMEVAAHLGVPHATLSRWYNAQRNPPPLELVHEKRMDLRQMLEAELNAIFNHMAVSREEASYRDVGTVAGIILDKLFILNNQPTERIAHEHSGQLTIEQRTARLAELLDAARTRRDGSSAHSADGHTIH